MPVSVAGPCPEILDFLSSLPPGSVVAQLEDGSIAVCNDLEEADRRIVESQIQVAKTARHPAQRCGAANV
jgi:hypothetical protein